jgi:hypothetical protein
VLAEGGGPMKVGDLVMFESVNSGDGQWVVEFWRYRIPMVVIELGPSPFHIVAADPAGNLKYPRRSSLTAVNKI